MSEPPNLREVQACKWCVHYDFTTESCEKYANAEISPYSVCDEYKDQDDE